MAGTPRDSLRVLDVLYDRDGGQRPQMIVTDTSSYSDIVSRTRPVSSTRASSSILRQGVLVPALILPAHSSASTNE